MIQGIIDSIRPTLISSGRTEPAEIEKIVPYKFLMQTFGPEKMLEGFKGIVIINKYYYLSIVGCILYVIFLHYGPKLMKDRKPFNLRIPLALWNLFLSIFSTIGFFRTTPLVLYLFYKTNFDWLFCIPSSGTYLHGPVGFWAWAFAVSKFFELIDTVFLVLRKKQVGFLHWFHHLTVLWFTMDATSREASLGITFVIMNYFVHSIMYFYYFLSAIGKPPKWALPVTILQILQMFGGCFFVIRMSQQYYNYGAWRLQMPLDHNFPLAPIDKAGTELYLKNNGCSTCLFTIICGILIYGSYLYLFCEFAVSRYINTKKNSKKIDTPSKIITNEQGDIKDSKLKKREQVYLNH